MIPTQAFGLAFLSLFTCAAALSHLHGDVPAVRHHRRLARRAAITKCKAKAHPLPATAGHNATAPATKKKPKKGGSGRKGACFPYGAAFHGSKPSVPASKWWCSDDRAVGFLGFSLPLESLDCGDFSNSVERLTTQFLQMKKDYGARYVRIYAPQCNDQSIWANLIEAGVAADMAVLPQIWWGFNSDPEGDAKARQAALLAEIKSNPLAPYVFHSVAFGSEPIGDGVDGGIQQFTTDFIAFKAALKPFGIRASVSEDWDRWGSLLGADGKLNADGQRLMDAQDLVHAHVMPYYAGDDAKNPSPTGGSAWGYVEHAVGTFLPSIAGGKKVMVTEIQWASALGPHGRDIGNSGVSLGDETAFWQNNAAKDHCSTWLKSGTGYFFHVWSDNSGEAPFGLLDGSDQPKFSFKPAC